jgi:hypothetical protein
LEAFFFAGGSYAEAKFSTGRKFSYWEVKPDSTDVYQKQTDEGRLSEMR